MKRMHHQPQLYANITLVQAHQARQTLTTNRPAYAAAKQSGQLRPLTPTYSLKTPLTTALRSANRE
jgi:hypothetical protein